MRLLAFALLTVAISVGMQLGFGQWDQTAFHGMHGIDTVLFFLFPAIVTAVLARAMRISNTGCVIALAVFSPFLSFAIFAYIRVAFLHDHLL